MSRQIQAGSVNQSIPFKLLDSTTGDPKTSITITDLDFSYWRIGSSPSAKVDLTALSAVTDAHEDNKAIEVGSTYHPGIIRMDVPDAAFASGATEVILTITGTGIKPCSERVFLTTFNPVSNGNGTPTSTTLFSSRTTDGESSSVTLNGDATIHVSGTFSPYATLELWTRPTGSGTWTQLNEEGSEFKHAESRSIFLIGDLKVVLDDAGSTTSVTVVVDKV